VVQACENDLLEDEVRALWALVYEIDPAREAEYLDWFHGVHIPEKLDRPGYISASHYRIVGSGATGHGFVAMFGAAETRTFLDPSPAQLRERQDALTRRMVGCRAKVQGMVLAEEWRMAGKAAPIRGTDMGAPAVVLSLFDAADGADDAVGAWHVQELAPRIAANEGCLRIRKLLASIGSCRHALVIELASTKAWGGLAARQRLSPDEATTPAHVPTIGQRNWPAP
jgi:hypothetical protein